MKSDDQIGEEQISPGKLSEHVPDIHYPEIASFETSHAVMSTENKLESGKCNTGNSVVEIGLETVGEVDNRSTTGKSEVLVEKNAESGKVENMDVDTRVGLGKAKSKSVCSDNGLTSECKKEDSCESGETSSVLKGPDNEGGVTGCDNSGIPGRDIAFGEIVNGDTASVRTSKGNSLHVGVCDREGIPKDRSRAANRVYTDKQICDMEQKQYRSIDCDVGDTNVEMVCDNMKNRDYSVKDIENKGVEGNKIECEKTSQHKGYSDFNEGGLGKRLENREDTGKGESGSNGETKLTKEDVSVAGRIYDVRCNQSESRPVIASAGTTISSNRSGVVFDQEKGSYRLTETVDGRELVPKKPQHVHFVDSSVRQLETSPVKDEKQEQFPRDLMDIAQRMRDGHYKSVVRANFHFTSLRAVILSEH